MGRALVLVSRMMRRRPAASGAFLGAIGTVVSLTVTAVLQAVDGDRGHMGSGS